MIFITYGGRGAPQNLCPIGRNVRVHVIGNKTMHVQVMLKSTKPKLRVKIIH